MAEEMTNEEARVWASNFLDDLQRSCPGIPDPEDEIEELRLENKRLTAILPDVIRDYFRWHKEMGYVSHKDSDVDEFVNQALKGGGE